MNFQVDHTDSNRTARLKLIYLIPASIFVTLWVGVRAAYLEAQGQYTDARMAWDHQPD